MTSVPGPALLTGTNKAKTELKVTDIKKKLVKKAWGHFSFLKRAGRHQKRARAGRTRRTILIACNKKKLQARVNRNEIFNR